MAKESEMVVNNIFPPTISHPAFPSRHNEKKLSYPWASFYFINHKNVQVSPVPLSLVHSLETCYLIVRAEKFSQDCSFLCLGEKDHTETTGPYSTLEVGGEQVACTHTRTWEENYFKFRCCNCVIFFFVHSFGAKFKFEFFHRPAESELLCRPDHKQTTSSLST